MTDKEEFYKIWCQPAFKCGCGKCENPPMIKPSLNNADNIWKWFQSKQQEKTERVKKLKTLTIGLITEVKLIELSDVLSILEEE